MTLPQTILLTTIHKGPRTFNLLNTDTTFTSATIAIDRTVAGGLNTLTQADTLSLDFQYSPDGGTTWLSIAGSTLEGGLIVTKGVTLTTDTLSVGIGVPFPVGTGFRVNTVASTNVAVAGTVSYNN